MEQMWFLHSRTSGPLSGVRSDSEERQVSTVQVGEVQVVFVSEKVRQAGQLGTAREHSSHRGKSNWWLIIIVIDSGSSMRNSSVTLTSNNVTIKSSIY